MTDITRKTETDKQGKPGPKVTFQVTTHFKRQRGDDGITRTVSERLSLGDAVDWILYEIPEDALHVDHDMNADVATIVIDWAKVPDEIRYGAMK